MKIIAGSLKGMKLLAPKDSITTRPTSAKVREAILHKLEPEIQDSVFIDLFSGTGAVGLEALSRGGKGCFFIEKDFSVLRLLKKNMTLALERLKKQGVDPHPFRALSIPAAGAFKSLKLKDLEESSFVLWADPPYRDFIPWWKTFRSETHLLSRGLERVVVELSAEFLKHPDFSLDSWEKDFEKVYGSTAVVGFKKVNL